MTGPAAVSGANVHTEAELGCKSRISRRVVVPSRSGNSATAAYRSRSIHGGAVIECRGRRIRCP